jgi:hypothetical protein
MNDGPRRRIAHSRRVLWGWHAAVADHALSKPNSGLGVYMLCVYMLDVSQAAAGRVLDTPRPPRSAPLDLGPEPTVDCEPVGWGATSETELDCAVSSGVVVGAHVLPRFAVSPQSSLIDRTNVQSVAAVG